MTTSEIPSSLDYEPTVLQAFSLFMADHFDDHSLIDAPDWLVIVGWFDSIGLNMTVDQLREALAIAERVKTCSVVVSPGYGELVHTHTTTLPHLTDEATRLLDYLLNGDDQ